MSEWKWVQKSALDQFRDALPDDCVRQADSGRWEWRSPIEGITADELNDVWLNLPMDSMLFPYVDGWFPMADLIRTPPDQILGLLVLMRLR